MSRLLLIPLLFASVTAPALTACDDSAGPDDLSIDFQPGPASFPPGSEIAVLQGDPSQAAPYTVRVRFADGYRLPPHFHPTDEQVTVVRGTFLVGMGDIIDLESVVTMGPGGFITAPAGSHHFAVARGQTIVQVHGLGPFAISYVNPADAQRTNRFSLHARPPAGVANWGPGRENLGVRLQSITLGPRRFGRGDRCCIPSSSPPPGPVSPSLSS